MFKDFHPIGVCVGWGGSPDPTLEGNGICQIKAKEIAQEHII